MEPLFFIVAAIAIIGLGAFLGRFVPDDGDVPATVGGSAHDPHGLMDMAGADLTDIFD